MPGPRAGWERNVLWLPPWGGGPGATLCLKLLLAAGLTQSLTSLNLSRPIYKVGLADHGPGVGKFVYFARGFTTAVTTCCARQDLKNGWKKVEQIRIPSFRGETRKGVDEGKKEGKHATTQPSVPGPW